MITEEEIPEIVNSMNKGEGIPEGVLPAHINRLKKVYSYIYFEGLGTYKVDEPEPIKIYTDQESIAIKNGIYE